MAIKNVLASTDTIIPIPGLISIPQVDNIVLAIKELREGDLGAVEKAELHGAATEMWNNLPANYQWLKDWEYV